MKGSIDYKDLKTAMRALAFEPTDEEIAEIKRNIGRDNIDFDEFQQLMTDKILNRDPMETMKKAFKLFDDDSTGKINFKNLRRVVKELGERIHDDEILEMIQEADKDGDGEVNFEEFVEVMKSMYQ